jgi:hypothetical protein
VLGRRGAAAPAPAAAPVAVGQLAERAHAKLATQAPQPAIDRQGPVTAVYRQDSSVYLGTLTLWLACAGSGRITLVVQGLPSSESDLPSPYEMTRSSVTCTEDPVPVRAAIGTADAMTGLVFELADSAGAAGRAGFAYRVTSSTGAPLSPQDGSADPTGALNLTSDAGYGVGVNFRAGIHYADKVPLHGRYTLAGACAGTGTLYGTVHGRPFKLKCQWPPKRHDIRLPAIYDSTAKLTLDYRAAEADPVQVAIQFIPR